MALMDVIPSVTQINQGNAIWIFSSVNDMIYMVINL